MITVRITRWLLGNLAEVAATKGVGHLARSPLVSPTGPSATAAPRPTSGMGSVTEKFLRRS